jgi:GalNAc-alpha-(1->4)-GalNAc-alpha-(1->3)-diNAcBac-PP-undecaprenol alpha-1,4-N-acetyl-D-galactosaminyltransferase
MKQVSSNSLKIAVGIHSLGTGGMERVASVLLSELSKFDGLELHLILYGSQRDLFYSLAPGVMTHLPNFAFSDYSRPIATLKTVFFIRNSLKKIRPDAVFNFGEKWNNLVLGACFGAGLPIFVSDRCQPDKKLGFLHETLRRVLYPRAKAVIAQTAYAESVYRQMIPTARYSVIPNPIVIPAEAESTKREPLVLSVGRLIETKHHDRLIRIFHQRRDRHWKLAILGDDPLGGKTRDRLRELCASLGESDSVELPGTVSDVASWYRRAGIFAFTSSSEGFPNALAEAMSYGLPCIAYDCIAGPRDLLGPSTFGFLVNLFDDQSFLEMLDRLTASDPLRLEMGATARTSMNRFASEQIAKKYLELVSSLC